MSLVDCTHVHIKCFFYGDGNCLLTCLLLRQRRASGLVKYVIVHLYSIS